MWVSRCHMETCLRLFELLYFNRWCQKWPHSKSTNLSLHILPIRPTQLRRKYDEIWGSYYWLELRYISCVSSIRSLSHIIAFCFFFILSCVEYNFEDCATNESVVYESCNSKSTFIELVVISRLEPSGKTVDGTIPKVNLTDQVKANFKLTCD